MTRLVPLLLIALALLIGCGDSSGVYDGWEFVGNPASSPIRALAVSSDTPDCLYLATLGDGLWLSNDAAASWSQIAETAEQKVYCLLPAGKDLYLGCDNGLWLFRDGTASSLALAGEAVWSLAESADGILVGTVGMVYLHNSLGTKPLDGKLPDCAITALVALPDEGEQYLAGTLGAGLWSYNATESAWQPLTFRVDAPLDAAEIILLDYHSESQTLYAGTMNNGLYLSDDGGLTWYKERGIDPEYKQVGALLQLDERLFITTTGLRPNGIYYASLHGDHWRHWADSPHNSRGLLQLPDGSLLVATETEGLFTAYPPEVDRLKPTTELP